MKIVLLHNSYDKDIREWKSIINIDEYNEHEMRVAMETCGSVDLYMMSTFLTTMMVYKGVDIRHGILHIDITTNHHFKN